MSTSFNGSPGVSPGNEVKSFVYQDISSRSPAASQARTPGGTESSAAASGQETRHSETDLARLIAEARAEGFREGQRQAQASAESAVQKERDRVKEVIASFQRERKDYYSRVEAELVGLALAIAAKILHREAQVDRMLVAGLVKVALENFQQGTTVLVRVRSEDVERWKIYFSDNPSIEVQEDANVQPESCILETKLGSTELGLHSQLKEIEQGFFDLLAQRPDPA